MESISKCGVVALVGPPNAGKSTLLNALVEQKISIVTPKPQTTRNRIAGILNGPDYQIVLLDTPGLHQTEQLLNMEMVKVALQSLPDADVIIFIADATLPPPPRAKSATAFLETGKPTILLLNKIDLLERARLLPKLKAYQELFPFTALVPVSALNREGLEIVLTEILNHLPAGQRLYPEDIPTDVTVRFIAGEIIREKIFLLTGQEIPYATAVVVDSFQEEPAKELVTIHATIFVERSSQKGILIGKQGAKLKEIGRAARREIGELLEQRVVLKLWIKVQKNWTKDPKFLRELGF